MTQLFVLTHIFGQTDIQLFPVHLVFFFARFQLSFLNVKKNILAVIERIDPNNVTFT